MLFRPRLIEKIIAGKKTQTRRLVKFGDLWQDPNVLSVVSGKATKYRLRYRVGSEYKIQPGRGKKTIINNGKPLTIEITDIRWEDVRKISLEDAIAEGFTDRASFWHVWADINDRAFPTNNILFEDIEHWISKRPKELYTAWALTFVVKE